jgi:catalase
MWYNDRGDYWWVKIHFKTDQGVKNLTLEESIELSGSDPDHATRSLYDAIEKGEYPSWTVQVQVMDPKDAEKYRFDPYDITKVWPHADYPVMDFGRMVLNKNPDNYFADVEQAAFSPGNFVPGVGASPDKMLQGRLFSYHDTHRHRLGPNYHLIPVNAPRGTKETSYQRDGSMRTDGNQGGGPNYWPNSFGGPSPDPSVRPPAIDVAGMAARHEYELGDVDFVQPKALYEKVMTDEARDHLVKNIVAHLGDAKERIQLRQAALFYKVTPEYGTRVAEGLGLDVGEVERLAGMSQEERVAATGS